jgi:hypothetical protein
VLSLIAIAIEVILELIVFLFVIIEVKPPHMKVAPQV